jgi:RNA recognition motif-containing protein
MNIYVGNLDFNTTSDEIKKEFEKHGQVESVQIITDKSTGNSKGFGFVNMPSDDEAKTAIRALDGQTFGQRAMKVNEAKPRESSGGNRGSRY